MNTICKQDEIQDTLKQKYKHEESPQIRKTGVDQVLGPVRSVQVRLVQVSL